MLTPELLHYLSIGILIGLGSIGAGIGQGIAAFSSVGSMARQPAGNDPIFRSMVIGLAFIESGAIFALVITLLLLFTVLPQITFAIAIAELGISLAVGIAALSISIASSFAVRATAVSISRQPFFAQKIITLMLLAQSIIEAPVVFAFVVALIIKMNLTEATTLFEGLKFLAASCCIALGCVGPSFGQAIFANSSCKAVGLNKDVYNKIFTFSIINEAVIETPLIFSLLISIMLIFLPIPFKTPLSSTIGFLVSAFAVGIGSFGTAVSAGYVGSRSCNQLALNPENYSFLFRSTILAQAFIESSVIYCLIIALFLITKRF
ncbi:hypothetical protein GF322_03025 [Candidatus Dependentiae bacterium]|nr:hypothetical protein [Candidatus Dependentiae bacterium]